MAERPDARPPEIRELLDLIEELVRWLRVATFEEQDGEREMRDRVRELLGRYKRAT